MTKKQKKMLWRIIATAVIILVIKLFSIGGIAGTLLYLAAYGIIGYDILRKAGKGIVRGQVFDENFLMAVATVGAIGLAFYEKSGDFLEAVAVMLFYQIGELFQSYAVGKSRRSITALMDIRPDYANIEQDGQLTTVDPGEVPVGCYRGPARRKGAAGRRGAGGLLHAEYRRPDRRESAPGRDRWR